MYILSFDLGSSNFKALILKLEENEKEGNIELIGKVRENIADFALFISKIKENYKIENKDIEVIVATGTGSSYLSDSYEGIKIIKIDEFDAVGYGGLILSKHEEGIIVSIGTGTTILYSDMKKNVRLGGTGLGGGTFVGLGKAILGKKVSFLELVNLAKNGHRANVDLTIGDINNGSIMNLTPDVTAANFAGVNKKAEASDYIDAALNLVLENICLVTNAYKMPYKNLDVIFIGTMASETYIQKRILEVGNYIKDKYIFVDNSDFAIAIGAYEYYLLRIRGERYKK